MSDFAIRRQGNVHDSICAYSVRGFPDYFKLFAGRCVGTKEENNMF